MGRIVDYCKQYFGVISIVISISILLTYSLSRFFVTSDNHRSAEMYISELKYSIAINDINTNTITVPNGETIIDLTIDSLNDASTYFKLFYETNSNVSISYFKETKNTSDVVTTHLASEDLINAKNSGTLKLKIINNSSSEQTIVFKITGGYSTNTLNDIIVPSGYTKLTKEENTTNTYFCKTNDTLTQGLTYIDGQYTYRYMKSVLTKSYRATSSGGGSSSSGTTTSKAYMDIVLKNETFDGWSADLTDTLSSDSVTSKLCTYVNNKPIVSMRNMFYYSVSNEIDLSSFNTHNVIDMSLMFQESRAISLDLSTFDTSKVTTMSQMFESSKATTINGLENFNTSKVTDMSGMFYNSKASSLNLNSFNTSNVINMTVMFKKSKVTTLDLSNFNTSNVTNMAQLFRDSAVTSLNISSFNTSNVTNMYYMFAGSKLTKLDVSNFNTKKVTNMAGMFSNLKVTSLDLSKFDTTNVVYMNSMFNGCTITSLNLSNFNTSKVTNMHYMFSNTVFNTLDLSNFDTSKVTDMAYMFSRTKATTLNLSNFNTSNVTTMVGMFQFAYPSILDLSSFDTSNVTTANTMFVSSKVKTIYASNKFVTTKITDGVNMFGDTTNLVGGNGTKSNNSNCGKEYARIDTASTPGYFTLKG